jgi:hemerythrin superfamily protein
MLREATKPGCVMPQPLVKANACALRTMVSAHASMEDALLFEKLKRIPVVRHALNEHKEIEGLLDQAVAEGDQKVLNHAARLILGHFAEEEKDVLPLLEQKIPPAKLAQLGLDYIQLRAIKV